jgi:hypothetical protein
MHRGRRHSVAGGGGLYALIVFSSVNYSNDFASALAWFYLLGLTNPLYYARAHDGELIGMRDCHGGTVAGRGEILREDS